MFHLVPIHMIIQALNRNLNLQPFKVLFASGATASPS